MNKKNVDQVYLFLAQGFEDVEALATVDVLRRADIDIKTVSVTDKHEVESAHGVTFKSDILIREISNNEKPKALILPGGLPGADNLYACKQLVDMLQQQLTENRLVAAICASPGVVLGQAKIIENRKATCYPSFEKYFPQSTTHETSAVVCDGNLITAQGPAYSFDFAFEILRHLAGEEKVNELKKGMLFIQ